MTEREALKLARSVISSVNQGKQHALTHNEETVFWQREEWVRWALDEVLPLIDQVLAQPEQEPVAFDVKCDACEGNGLDSDDNNYKCVACSGLGFAQKLLYTTPPQRKPWVGLTKKEVHDLFHPDFEIFHQRIEAKLKDKNT